MKSSLFHNAKSNESEMDDLGIIESRPHQVDDPLCPHSISLFFPFPSSASIIINNRENTSWSRRSLPYSVRIIDDSRKCRETHGGTGRIRWTSDGRLIGRKKRRDDVPCGFREAKKHGVQPYRLLRGRKRSRGERRDERTSGTRTKTVGQMEDGGGSMDHLYLWWGGNVESSSFLFFRTLRHPSSFLFTCRFLASVSLLRYPAYVMRI